MMVERWRHFYLYAKYHYKKTDILEDLKTILAHECGLSLESVCARDVIHILAREAWRHMKDHDFGEFIAGASPNSMRRWAAGLCGEQVEYDFNLSVIYMLLATLSQVVIFSNDETLIDLGEPDFSILPESESRKKWRAKQEARQCRKCATPLDSHGLCTDVTCPYSDRQQTEEYTEG